MTCSAWCELELAVVPTLCFTLRCSPRTQVEDGYLLC